MLATCVGNFLCFASSYSLQYTCKQILLHSLCLAITCKCKQLRDPLLKRPFYESQNESKVLKNASNVTMYGSCIHIVTLASITFNNIVTSASISVHP